MRVKEINHFWLGLLYNIIILVTFFDNHLNIEFFFANHKGILIDTAPDGLLCSELLGVKEDVKKLLISSTCTYSLDNQNLLFIFLISATKAELESFDMIIG